jgi:hypothetical protein
MQTGKSRWQLRLGYINYKTGRKRLSKTAKTLGLTVPLTLVGSADKMIE